MAAIVQGLERQIVVLDVVGSIPTSRPILSGFSTSLSLYTLRSALGLARQIALIVYLRLYAIRFLPGADRLGVHRSCSIMKRMSCVGRFSLLALVVFSLTFPASAQVGLRNGLDFDGDGRADYCIWGILDSTGSIRTEND